MSQTSKKVLALSAALLVLAGFGCTGASPKTAQVQDEAAKGAEVRLHDAANVNGGAEADGDAMQGDHGPGDGLDGAFDDLKAAQ